MIGMEMNNLNNSKLINSNMKNLIHLIFLILSLVLDLHLSNTEMDKETIINIITEETENEMMREIKDSKMED